MTRLHDRLPLPIVLILCVLLGACERPSVERADTVRSASEVPDETDVQGQNVPEDVRKKAKQRAAAVPSGDAVEFHRYASRPAFSPSRAMPLLGKAEEEADAALIAPVPAQEAMPQEEPKSLLTDARTGQRIGRADTKHQVDRSPKDWLADISQLFRAGKRREAEESLQAFQDRYPDYTDFPASFPEDVLKRLRTSTAQLSTTPQSR